MLLRFFTFITAFAFLSSCQSIHLDGKNSSAIVSKSGFEARGSRFAVASQGVESSRIAMNILEKGGTVVDAAIAATFAISVERPQSTGIGGGGFLIHFDAKAKKATVYDFRETAPRQVSSNMFVGKDGKPIPGASTDGGLAVAVPGIVEGMDEFHRRGKARFSMKDLVHPAQELAEKGVTVSSHLANAIEEEKEKLSKSAVVKKNFFHADGTPLQAGERLVQPELAKFLEKIAEQPRNFYSGTGARAILQTLKQNHALFDAADFSRYRIRVRKPLDETLKIGSHSYELISLPPPSSGGIHVLQFLKMMKQVGLQNRDRWDFKTLNLMGQSFQQAFADRAEYLADPDFVKVPVKNLLRDDYLATQAAKLDGSNARKANEVRAGSFEAYESNDTTHFSIADREGNVVISTQSVNTFFGSKVYVDELGFFLNNSMDDFSQQAGALNAFGAVGSEKNLPAPGKRPLSSMSPTIVLENGKLVVAMGCPNGTRIISGVAQVALNKIFFGMDLMEAVAAPRIHHQWQPDQFWVEQVPALRTQREQLENLGYAIKDFKASNFIQAVAIENGEMVSVSDPRDVPGALAR